MLFEIDEETIQRHIDQWIAKIEQEEKEKQEFITKKRINDVIERVYNYLLSHNVLDGENLEYKPDQYPITPGEFRLLFDCICEYGENLKLECQEEDNPFHHRCFCMTYKDINMYFRVMHGQGTCEQICSVSDDDKDWKSEIAFTFSGMGTLV